MQLEFVPKWQKLQNSPLNNINIGVAKVAE